MEGAHELRCPGTPGGIDPALMLTRSKHWHGRWLSAKCELSEKLKRNRQEVTAVHVSLTGGLSCKTPLTMLLSALNCIFYCEIRSESHVAHLNISLCGLMLILRHCLCDNNELWRSYQLHTVTFALI